MLSRIAERSGRPVLYSLTQYHEQPDDYRAILGLNRRAADRGVPIRPVVAPRAIGVLLGLQASQTPFSGCPTFRALAGLPLAAGVARLRDPAVRAAILAEDPVRDSTFPLLRLLSYDRMYRFGTPPNYTPQACDSVAAIAARTSRPAPEVAYDLLLAWRSALTRSNSGATTSRRHVHQASAEPQSPPGETRPGLLLRSWDARPAWHPDCGRPRSSDRCRPTVSGYRR